MLKDKLSFGQKKRKLRSTSISTIQNWYTFKKYLPAMESVDKAINNILFLYPVETSENQNFPCVLKWNISVKQVKEVQIDNVDNKVRKSNL